MTHCTAEEDSDSWPWMLGTAIETIVWSMNVIATANTIAVSARYFDPEAGAAVVSVVSVCAIGHPPSQDDRDRTGSSSIRRSRRDLGHLVPMGAWSGSARSWSGPARSGPDQRATRR